MSIKTMRKTYMAWVLILAIASSILVKADTIEDYQQEYKQLTPSQLANITKAFNYGKQHNLQWTLAAKSWEESLGGLVKISLNTHPKYGKDYGLTQVNIYWFLKANNIKDTPWNRMKYGTKLITDDIYCLNASITNIRKWELSKQSWQSYRYVWAHYNGGIKPNWNYAERIAKRIQVLRNYLNNSKDTL